MMVCIDHDYSVQAIMRVAYKGGSFGVRSWNPSLSYL